MAFVEFVHYEASCDNSCVDRNIFLKLMEEPQVSKILTNT